VLPEQEGAVMASAGLSVERRARYPWFGLFAAFTVAMMNSGTVVRSAAAPRR
jgi:hypothetical protein